MRGEIVDIFVLSSSDIDFVQTPSKTQFPSIGSRDICDADFCIVSDEWAFSGESSHTADSISVPAGSSLLTNKQIERAFEKRSNGSKQPCKESRKILGVEKMRVASMPNETRPKGEGDSSSHLDAMLAAHDSKRSLVADFRRQFGF